MTYSIRAYQKTDFDTLWRIDQVCFEPKLAYSRFELAVYMRRPGSFTLVAETAGEKRQAGTSGKAAQVLGFIVAECRRKTGHIITIDVVQMARRAGVGSSLLRAAEEQLRQAGAITIELETPVNNEAAIRFYKRAGYFVEKTVSRYYHHELDALAMRKDVAENARLEEKANG